MKYNGKEGRYNNTAVEAGGMVQTKELQAGGQFGATNSFTLHFGLSKATKVDRIVVRWPNRKLRETVLTDVEVNQNIEIDLTERAIADLLAEHLLPRFRAIMRKTHGVGK